MDDDFNTALIECVKSAGGSAAVGAKLWPEKEPKSAQRYLLDCLHPDRPHHLTPEQALLVLRMARDKGCHRGMEYLAAHLSYAMPVTLEPRDEAAELQRQFIAAAESMSRLAARIERLSPVVRAA